MVNQVEKASSVMWVWETKLATSMQHFRSSLVKICQEEIRFMHGINSFQKLGVLCKCKHSGRPRVSEKTVQRVHATYVHNPETSKVMASQELSVQQPTVWKILQKQLTMLQVVQAIYEDNKEARHTFYYE
jgi:hypothetical protein